MTSESEISRYMTVSPFSIDVQASLREAMNIMNHHNLEYLPVRKSEHIIGFLAAHELRHVIAFAKGMHFTIGDLINQDMHLVDPHESVAQVLHYMLKNKVSCVMVGKKGRVVGVFSSEDALRLFHKSITESQ